MLAYPHVAGVEVDGDVVRLVGYAVLGEELDDVVLRDELLVQVEGGVGVAAVQEQALEAVPDEEDVDTCVRYPSY